MNFEQKQIRRDVKKGITIEGGSGNVFIVNSKATFSNEKDSLTVLLKVKGQTFEGRVKIKKIPEEGEGVFYRVIFLERKGWFYHPIKDFSGVHSRQLTAVLDAVVWGTGQVESV